MRDWSLASGERQVSPVFADVNAAHRARYAWAAACLRGVPVTSGADVFAASGYGTAYLAAQCGGSWHGYDASAETIAVAQAAHPHIAWTVAEFPCPLPVAVADVVVSIESIEHVDADREFASALAQMLTPGGHLLVSVPNEDRIPCDWFGNTFHVRHYTPDTLAALFDGLGLTLVGAYGQRVHRIVDTGWEMVRKGRVPDAEQDVRPLTTFDAPPCTLLSHYRRVA